jgi:UDPglucose 6-dehydrogenase
MPLRHLPPDEGDIPPGDNLRLCIVGTGYVGLVAAAGFADMGHHVICHDIDASKMELLRAGTIPIYEAGLKDLVTRNLAQKRLSFTTDLSGAAACADVIMLAVGTPPQADGAADLSLILDAAEKVGRALRGNAVLVTKSTVPVGTGDRLEALMGRITHHNVAVASNPEFLKEGDAVNDFMKPDRIVVGCSDRRAFSGSFTPRSIARATACW